MDMTSLDCPIVAETAWPRVEEARLALFLRHWASARVGAVVPRRSAIDPGAIAPCLPYVYLYRVDLGSGEFTCSLSGEEINTAWGFSLIGKRQRDFMPPAIMGPVRARFRAIVATPAILFSGFRGGRTLLGVTLVRRIIAPLTLDDGTPYGVFGIAVYVNDPEGRVPAPVEPTVDAVLYDCKALPPTPP
jgi:hypothetical protein